MANVKTITASDGISAPITLPTSSSKVVIGVASKGSSDRPSFSPTRLCPAKVMAPVTGTSSSSVRKR